MGYGLWMPDDFVPPKSSEADIKIISVAFGFQVGFTVLTAAKAGTQTLKIWKRTRQVTGYMAMVWCEVLANIAIGILAYLFINGIIQPGFGIFFSLVCFWCIELHLLIQIIVNRLSLLIQSRKERLWIKWGSFAIILVINIGVFCIWIPARMQISQTYVNINNIFDRGEKIAYLILDACLNFYFCRLVKKRLIDAGLTKYQPLYRFNVGIVFVSLSMDVLLIGMMSLPNGLIYTIFHPVTFMIKLNIEMSMAHMISKVARAPGQGFSYSAEPDTSDLKMSNGGASRSNGTKNGGAIHQSLAGTTFVATGPGRSGRSSGRKASKFEPTMSEFLNEDRTDEQGERMYQAWVSGGSATHTYKGPMRPGQYGDDRDRSDVEAGIHVQQRASEEERKIMKNTTIHITTENIDDDGVSERDRRAPSESDSLKHLTGKGSS